MGWIKKVTPRLHVCDKPVYDGSFLEGSEWQCDDCTARWLLLSLVSNGFFKSEITYKWIEMPYTSDMDLD